MKRLRDKEAGLAQTSTAARRIGHSLSWPCSPNQQLFFRHLASAAELPTQRGTECCFVTGRFCFAISLSALCSYDMQRIGKCLLLSGSSLQFFPDCVSSAVSECLDKLPKHFGFWLPSASRRKTHNCNTNYPSAHSSHARPTCSCAWHARRQNRLQPCPTASCLCSPDGCPC